MTCNFSAFNDRRVVLIDADLIYQQRIEHYLKTHRLTMQIEKVWPERLGGITREKCLLGAIAVILNVDFVRSPSFRLPKRFVQVLERAKIPLFILTEPTQRLSPLVTDFFPFVSINRDDPIATHLELLGKVIRPLSDKNRCEKKLQPGTTLADSYPCSILLAEDVKVSRRLATEAFRTLGYKIEVAQNGAEAVDLQCLHQHDLIFMDLQMPEVDGFEATKQIRDQFQQKKQPTIIALTASEDPKERDRCREVGMDDFLEKPLLLETLERVLRRWVPLKKGVDVAFENSNSFDSTARQDNLEPHEGALQGTPFLDLKQLRHLKNAYNQQTLERLLMTFEESLQTIITDLHRSAAMGDYERLQFGVHKLRGLALSMAAVRVTQLCTQLKQHLEYKDLRSARERVQEIEQAGSEAFIILKKYLLKA